MFVILEHLLYVRFEFMSAIIMTADDKLGDN